MTALLLHPGAQCEASSQFPLSSQPIIPLCQGCLVVCSSLKSLLSPTHGYPQSAARAESRHQAHSCLCLQCSCLFLQDGQCRCACPQGLHSHPSQICPAQPTPGCCSLPSAQLPCPCYLYIVSASTSPNQTLRCAWKYSPCTSSMATSPPPVSCDGQRAWQGCVGYEAGPLVPQDALPVRLIPTASQNWEVPLGHKGSGAGGTRQAGDREGQAGDREGSPWQCLPAGQR